MFADLNPILHSQLRLAIISLLVSEEKADFARIKEVTKATSGNISVQIQKLEAAGYIVSKKRSKKITLILKPSLPLRDFQLLKNISKR